MNYVSLLGRLTRDVEVTYTQSGKAYARFSLAVSRGTSNRDEVDFINCIAWEKRAETISQYFKKGSRILVQEVMKKMEKQDIQLMLLLTILISLKLKVVKEIMEIISQKMNQQ